MACRGAKKKRTNVAVVNTEVVKSETMEANTQEGLLFGVDSKIQANDILQNNITLFEWAKRNKLTPNFWGRNIVGENCLTREEIKFLHLQGCKIAITCNSSNEKQTGEQGEIAAEEIISAALRLGIPEGMAIFLEIDENEEITTDYMRGFAETLIYEGYTPAFKANTDAKFDFDREFSRGLQINRDIFGQCLIWATAPSLADYERVTTTHLIHPDNWGPYAPSGITRNDVAIWQYGKECHPINDDADKETTFNINLFKNKSIMFEKMF